MRLLALATLILAGFAAPALAQSPYAGHWRGTLDVGSAQLRLDFVIEDTDGALSGYMISVDQGNARIPASAVDVEDGVLVVDLAMAQAGYRGTLTDNGAIDGRFSQAGQAFDLDLMPHTPQDTPAPAADPRDQAFSVDANGVRLAGTLRRPQGVEHAPALYIISGSGPQDRDMTVGEHRIFVDLADALATQGIASLRLDDRGVGESDAVIPDHPQEIADDAAAALNALRQANGINDQCVGLIGHSEGGMLAFLAADAGQPDFILALAPMVSSMSDTLLEQAEAMIRAAGGSEAQIAAQRDIQMAVMTAMRESPPGEAGPAIESALIARGIPTGTAQQQGLIWGSNYAQNALDLDPASAISGYDGPASFVFGALDLQVVRASSVARVESLRSSETTTIEVIEGANHLFQDAVTGQPGEYTSLPGGMSAQAGAAIAGHVSRMISEACGN
ncbi:alpha/beta fold hydrolase [Maricaulis sp.]|uniref:alpha/beta hydrolase family protein n=1 Tax=Maricaulis sp. TaxID=1486257 RepID=UPI00262FDF71|nr:alpha/beta fold hydrolase [Maricaulis sp.]